MWANKSDLADFFIGYKLAIQTLNENSIDSALFRDRQTLCMATSKAFGNKTDLDIKHLRTLTPFEKFKIKLKKLKT